MRRMNLEEDRCVLLEDFAVRAGGDILVGGEAVEDDAGAVQTSGSNALEREQGVVDATEAVGYDKDDRQRKSGGEVGDGFGRRDWNEPATGAFDEKGWVFLREVAEPGVQRGECDGAVLECGCDERGCGSLKPDGVGFVERQALAGCGLEDFDIVTRPAAKWLESDSLKAFSPQSACEECGAKGFSGVGVCAGDEEVHL